MTEVSKHGDDGLAMYDMGFIILKAGVCQYDPGSAQTFLADTPFITEKS